MTTCLNFLNDQGQIIYYGNANDIFLRNTIILRPQKLVEIFNLVLDAKQPSCMQQQEQQQQNSNVKNDKLLELWDQFDQRGILNDYLLDVMWESVQGNQKPGLLGLMKKFDLICVRNGKMSMSTPQSASSKFKSTTTNEHHVNQREYLVPSRAKIAYDEEESVADLIGSSLPNHDYDDDENESENSYYNHGIHNDAFSYDDSGGEGSIDSYTRPTKSKKKKLLNNGLNVEFYYDFCGFLPGKI